MAELAELKPFKVNVVGVVWPSIVYVASEGLCGSSVGMKPYQLSWVPMKSSVTFDPATVVMFAVPPSACHEEPYLIAASRWSRYTTAFWTEAL